MNRNQSLYFGEAMTRLADAKVDVHLSRTKKVDDCSGYFCDKPLSLGVSMWRKDWFTIFIHEYCHFKQWRSGSEVWDKTSNCDFFETWTQKDRRLVQKLEQDCDMRVWNDVVTNDLSGFDDHIAASNAYHASYRNMQDRKSWFSKNKSSYIDEDIKSLCPNDRFFTLKELDKPDNVLYNLIDERCFQ